VKQGITGKRMQKFARFLDEIKINQVFFQKACEVLCRVIVTLLIWRLADKCWWGGIGSKRPCQRQSIYVLYL
jgi:hypothetical protein